MNDYEERLWNESMKNLNRDNYPENEKFYNWISEEQLKALMIQAMQELEKRVKHLEARVQQLERYHD